MRSETISELAKALANFQGKMTAVKKDATNPFYKSKYATLDTIWEAIRKPLSENGLSVVQTMNVLDGKSVLETTLYHTSGEWISGIQLVNPVKDDPQSLGSAISYARRYSLSAILGIVADDDDDAEVATPKVKPTTAVKPTTTTVKDTAKPVSPEKPVSTDGERGDITPAQMKKLGVLGKEKGIDKTRVYMTEHFGGKTSRKELTKDEASQLIEYLDQQDDYLVAAAKEMGAEEE